MKKQNEVKAKLTTIVGSNCVVDGNFTIAGSARVDGIVNGNLKAEGLVILGETCKVKGDVSAANIIAGGEVLGNLFASQKVEVTEKAKIFGDITTCVMVVDENAIFQGKCNMNQEEPAGLNSEKKTRATRRVKKSAKVAITEALKEVEEENRKEDDLNTESTAAGPEEEK